MRPDLVNRAVDTGEVLQLPLFASRFVMTYNLPGMTTSEEGIILDYATMSDIWMGKIINWNDGRIASLNPELAAAGRFPDLNITRVASSTGEREGERIFFTIVAAYSTGKSAYNVTKNAYGIAKAYLSSPWLVGQQNILSVDGEAKVQAAVINQIGAVGIATVSSLLETSTTRTRLMKSNGEVVTDSVTASYRCMSDTFNSTSYRITNAISKQPYVFAATVTYHISSHI
jgi:phosphate transport system substrate-binding protein